MANQLSVTKSSSIKQLHEQGWSQRQIAEAVGVDRKTVRRHLQPEETGDRPPPDSKGTLAPIGLEPVLVTERELRELANARKVPCIRFGRAVRYDPRDLREWLETQKEWPESK